MPELPDLTVYVHAIRARVLRQPLVGVRITSPFVLKTVTPPLDVFAGRQVLDVGLLGKRLVFSCDGDLHLVLHLMIAGRLQWKAPGTRPHARTGLAAFDFAHGTLALTEAGARRRASLHAVQGVAALAAMDPGGIDVLRATRDEFAAVLMRERHTLKRALTDPRLFSGIGNAYSDEILHAAGLSPMRQTHQLSAEDVTRLHAAAQATLVNRSSTVKVDVGEQRAPRVQSKGDGQLAAERLDEAPPRMRLPERLKVLDLPALAAGPFQRWRNSCGDFSRAFLSHKCVLPAHAHLAGTSSMRCVSFQKCSMTSAHRVTILSTSGCSPIVRIRAKTLISAFGKRALSSAAVANSVRPSVITLSTMVIRGGFASIGSTASDAKCSDTSGRSPGAAVAERLTRVCRRTIGRTSPARSTLTSSSAIRFAGQRAPSTSGARLDVGTSRHAQRTSLILEYVAVPCNAIAARRRQPALGRSRRSTASQSDARNELFLIATRCANAPKGGGEHFGSLRRTLPTNAKRLASSWRTISLIHLQNSCGRRPERTVKNFAPVSTAAFTRCSSRSSIVDYVVRTRGDAKPEPLSQGWSAGQKWIHRRQHFAVCR